MTCTEVQLTDNGFANDVSSLLFLNVYPSVFFVCQLLKLILDWCLLIIYLWKENVLQSNVCCWPIPFSGGQCSDDSSWGLLLPRLNVPAVHGAVEVHFSCTSCYTPSFEQRTGVHLLQGTATVAHSVAC